MQYPSLVSAPFFVPDDSSVPSTASVIVRTTATGSYNVVTGGQTITALNMGGASNVVFGNFTDVLTLTSGGIISGVDNSARSIGTVAVRGVLDTTGADIYLNLGANTLTINAQIGSSTFQSFGLVVDGATLPNAQAVTLTDSNIYTGATYISGAIVNLDNLTGSGYALGTGTSINLTGSNSNSATTSTAPDSLPAADSALVLIASNQINPSATVSIASEAEFNLNGYNQSLSALAFQSLGGSNGSNGPTILTGSGVLTLTATTGTIAVSNLQDLRTIPQLFGNLVLPSTAEITVAANADGSVINNGFTNQQVGLAINSNIANTGTITLTKDGAGALSLGGASTATIDLSVSAGEVVLAGNANYQNTTIALASGTALDMRGQTDLEVGSISGVAGSFIKNFSATAGGTLVTGGDNTSTGFAGIITSDYTSGLLNITKIGSGTWSLSGNSASQSLGTLIIGDGASVGAAGTASGGIYLSGTNGALGFTNYILNSGGSLVLDNNSNALSGRLGINGIPSSGSTGIGNAFDGQGRILTMQGGQLVIDGNSGTAVTETLGQTTATSGSIIIQNGGGIITFSNPGAGVALNIASTGFAFSSQNGTGTLLIQNAASSAGAGNGTLGLGTNATFNVTGSQGTGGNGTTTMPVRQDIIVDDTAIGGVIGFAVLDSTNKVIRPLAAGELDVSTAAGSTNNVGLGLTTTAVVTNLFTNVSANTLTLSSGSGFTNAWGSTGGNFGAGGALTITLTAAGILQSGGSTITSTGVITSNGTSMDIHVTGSNVLTLNNSIVNNTTGIVKADNGTLVFDVPQYYSGTAASNGTVINGGAIQLASGAANTILVNPNATTPTVLDLRLNGVGSALDLDGQNQAVGNLTSVNTLAGEAGNVVNTSSNTATLTVVQTSAGNFAGSIGGSTGTQAINFVKAGTNTLTLNGASSYTGSTTIMGSALVLRDSGSIAASTGPIGLDYSTLTYDNSGLVASANRLPTGATIDSVGGTFNYLASQGANNLTLGNFVVSSGQSTITPTLWASSSNFGSSVVLTLASLSQGDSNGMIDFTATGGTLGAPVTAVNGASPANGGSNSQILLSSAPTLVNGIIGGWAIANSTDFATYLSMPVNGSLGVGAMGSTNFPAYATDAITAGVPTDNITMGATTGGITARTINSFRVSGAFIATQNGLDQLITINTGGILSTGGVAGFQGGRYTAGAQSNQTLYFYNNGGTENFQSLITDNNLGPVNFVKSGAQQLNLGASPIVAVSSTTANSSTVTVTSTAGLAVGETLPTGATGVPANAIITGILSGTTITIGTNVTTGSTTAANEAFFMPGSEVLSSLSFPAAGANTKFNVTVPAGTELLPGSVVTLAANTGGTGSFGAGTVTVLSLSGNTATLIDTAAVTASSANATLIFGSVGTQTSTNATLNAGATTFNVPANTLGLNVGQVVTFPTGTATLPANTIVTAYNPATGQVTLSNPIGGTTTSTDTISFGGSSQSSLASALSTSSATVGVPSSVGLFVGEPVYGNGIPLGTTVNGIIDGGHITLSNTPTAGGAANLTYGSNVGTVGTNVSGISIPTSGTALTLPSVAGLAPGMSVIGYGVPAGETIASISGTTVTLSTATSAVAAGTTATLTFGAPLTNSANNVSVSGTTTATNFLVTLATTQGLYPGMTIGGPGIPAGDLIASITNATQVTLSAPTNATGFGTGTLSLSAPTQLVAFSEGYTGNTVVDQGTLQIGGTTVALVNANAGVVDVPGNLILNNANANANYFASTSTTQSGANATLTFSSTTGLAVGMTVSGTNIPAGDTIVSLVGATAILSAPSTATINSGTALNFSAGDGLIASTSNVTINGSGTLTMPNAGSNTLASITFNGTGGTTAPTVTGSSPTNLLVLNNGITATNNNLATTPTISVLSLELAGSNLTIATSGSSPDDLLITSPIQNAIGGTAQPAGLIKAGTGSLVLNPQIGLGSAAMVTTSTTVTLASTTGLSVGMQVTGTDIPANDVITSILSSTQIILQSAVTTNVTATLTAFGDNFTGGVQLTNGSLILGSSTSVTTPGTPMGVSTVANPTQGIFGPIGLGTLTISSGTSLLAGGAAQTILNPVVVNGSFTLGGGLTTNSLTLAGQVNIGASDPTITTTIPVTAANVSDTFSGGLVGTAGFTKAGVGTLALTSAGDNISGPINIAGGILQLSTATTLTSGQVLLNADVSVAAGAELDVRAGTTNGSGELGSLAGSGLVTNSAAVAYVLTVGADNASTLFSGAFASATAADLSITKIGLGTMTLTTGLDAPTVNGVTNSTAPTGTFTVNQGGVTISGAGTFNFATYALNSTGVLTLDNSLNSVVNRLSGKNVTIQGGSFVYNGSNLATTNASETIGTLGVTNGGGKITLNPGLGGSTTLTLGTFTPETAISGGSLLIQGASTTTGAGFANLVTGAAFSGTAGIAGVTQGTGLNNSTTMGIRADVIVDSSSTGTGIGFATVDSGSTKFIRALSATTELAPTLATGNNSTTNYGNFSSAQTYSAATSLNSLTLDTANAVNSIGGGQAIQGTVAQGYTNTGALNVLTVNTGGILAATSNTLNVGELIPGGTTPVQFEFHVTGSSVLNLNGFLAGTASGLVKADNGTLNLNNPVYYTGTTTVNGGTLVLNSGAANTLAVIPTATVPIVQALTVNGGTLNLNGFDQYVGALRNNNTVGGTGGSITSSTAANLVSATSSSSEYGGTIDGGLNFYMEGPSTLTLTGANTYSGTTNILGSVIVLQDSGSLNTSTINVNGGGELVLNDTGLSNNNNNRISTTASVNLNGGQLQIDGANYTSTSTTVGAGGTGVTLATGFNVINNIAPPAGTNNTSTLTIGNLNRTPGAVVNFTAGTNQTLGSALPGNPQTFITNLNGAAPALTGGILGGAYTVGDNWATYGGAQTLSVTTAFNSNIVTMNTASTADLTVGEMVSGGNIPAGSYITAITASTNATTTVTLSQLASGTGTANSTFNSAGVTALGANGYTSLVATPAGTANYTTTAATTTTLTGASPMSMNSLQFSGAATVVQTLDIGGAANVLDVVSGGIMRTSVGTIGTTTIQDGILTAGALNVGGELDFIRNNSGAMTVSAVIANNGSGTVSVVDVGGLTLTGANTYTGTTYVSGGLALNTTGANGSTIVAVPGNLVVNNLDNVTESAQGNIAATSNLTINGGGTVTLTGVNTLASVTFNNSLGGTVTPVLASGGTLTITAANAITEQNNDLTSTPTVSGTLALSNTAPVISVSGLSADDLILSAVIASTGGNLSITGGGGVVLSGASTFTGGVTLNASTIIFGASTTGSVTSGPVGTGTLAINGGSTIESDGTARTIANSTTINGNFTIGNSLVSSGVPAAGTSLTLTGAMTLGTAGPTITVSSPLDTAVISGNISSTATGTAFTKAGPGVLVVSGTDSLGNGEVVVAGGVLQVGSGLAFASTNAIQISAGAVFDTHGQATLSVGSLFGDTATTGGMVTDDSSSTTTILTIGGDNASTATFAGILTDTKAGAGGAGSLALTKGGMGDQILSGANTYSGATVLSPVAGNTLTIENLSTSTSFATLGNTAISVGAGATFAPIVASGAPTTVVNAGSALVAAGGASLTLGAGSTLNLVNGTTIGTFNLIQGSSFSGNAFTVSGTTGSPVNLDFDIGNAGADEIVVNKNASVTAGTGANLINLSLIAGATSIPTGVIPLIEAGGGFSGAGTTNNFTLETTSITVGGKTYSLTLAGSQDTATQTALEVSVAASANAYWAGAVDGNWNTNNAGGVTNWRTDATSNIDTQSVPVAATNVFFYTTNPVAQNLSTTLGAAFLINSLTFTSAATSDVSIGDGGNNTETLTLVNSGITMNNNAGTDTINANVVLGASQTWTNNSTGSNQLIVNGSSNTPSITGSGDNLQVAGTGNVTIAAPIETGTGTLTMSGTGTLLLSGTNTYTGATSVASGTLQLGAAGALGNGTNNTASVTVSNGAALDLNGLMPTATVPLNLNGQFSSSVGALTNSNVSTPATYAGPVTLQTASSIGGPGNLTVSSAIGDGGHGLGLTKVGTGKATLSGVNSYTGPTSVTQGTLIVSGSLAGTLATTTVSSGATLASGPGLAITGTTNYISGNLTAVSDTNGGGTVAPGDTGGSGTSTVGQLSVGGNLTLGTNTGLGNGPAHLSIELGGTTAGSSYDQVLVASGSTVDLNNVSLDVSLINSFIPFSGTVTGSTQNLDGNAFYLIVGANTTASGTFANATGSDPNLPGYSTFNVGSQEFAVSYSASYNNGVDSQFAHGSGNDVAIMAIPEPNSLSMLAGSLGLALGLQRFRRRRSRT
ncbi:MAG TPA: autotransporter-associated beta strand repeat-containing protein [Chthoniobacter sp.]